MVVGIGGDHRGELVLELGEVAAGRGRIGTVDDRGAAARFPFTLVGAGSEHTHFAVAPAGEGPAAAVLHVGR